VTDKQAGEGAGTETSAGRGGPARLCGPGDDGGGHGFQPGPGRFPPDRVQPDAGRAGPLVELGRWRPAARGRWGSERRGRDLRDRLAPGGRGPVGAQGLAPAWRGVRCSSTARTISPARAREFGARLASQGVAMVDAPVSGGSEGAKAGTLTIMVGGETGDVERARPCWAPWAVGYAHRSTGVGPGGQGGQPGGPVRHLPGRRRGRRARHEAGLDPEVVVGALSGGRPAPGSCKTGART